MKNKVIKFTLFFFSLIVLLNISGCANIYKKGTTEIYPLNYDYFWDKVFVQPIAWLLDITTSNIGSYALGILITTIIVRTILTPIYTKSNLMSTKMQELQPEIKKIQDKYVGRTDPDSRSKMSFEVMKLYKDNNVNMFAGCIMPFLQMPVFFAMYNAVVKVPVTFNYPANKLSFLGIILSKPDPTYVLPILVGITAYLLQKISMMGLTPEARNNQTMKMMMWLMPGMMLLFSFSQASALAFYWIVGNIYSTIQIIVFKKPFKRKKDNDGNVVNAKFREVQ